MPAASNYQRPEFKYRSYIDSTREPHERQDTGVSAAEAIDIDFVIGDLETLLYNAKSLYDTCVAEMQNYTLTLDTSDQVLIDSHRMSYPDDNTPDSISFNEYIYNFTNSRFTSSSYVNTYYENKVRGIYGTNALDVAHIARVTFSEANRILDFIQQYTGEIDDPSEFRTVEAFQNWAQDAKNLLEGYQVVYQAKGLAGIPGEELDQLDEGKSREFQALFQSKLNIINASISDIISQLYKDWDRPSNQFYNKVLGPSLKFSLKVSRSITRGLDQGSAPLLYQEADMTRLGLKSQFQAALNDQVKRNQLFYTYLEKTLQNMIQRDTYQKYLDQLSSKGRIIRNPFMAQISDEPDAIANSGLLLGEDNPVTFDVNADSDHNFLSNRDDPDAHPQYLLRSGDIIDGDLEVYGEMFLNGFGLTNMFEQDDDGALRLKTGIIGWGNIKSSDLVGSGDTFKPYDLAIASRREVPGGKFEYTIDFTIEQENVQSYEFEVIEL